MGNIGDTITETVPAVGSAGPTYASTINALLTEFRNRMIARIPLSSLLANSNLDMNGQAILNAAYITLTNEGVSPVASPVNRVAAYGGNLWWVSPTGAVQLTNGAALNAGGIGGITGDYSGAGPMEFRYDTANTRYDAFANQSTNTWAYVRARGFDIAGSATSAFRARLLFGGVANASYTLPAAVPAATAVLQMDTSGNITADTTDDIVLTGTADYKHGEKWITHPPEALTATSAYSVGVAADVISYTLTAAGVVYIPLRGLRGGDRIKAIKIGGDTAAEPTYAISIQTGGSQGFLAFTGENSLDANSTKTLVLDTPHTLVSPASTTSVDHGEFAVLRITTNGGNVTLYEVSTLIDRV